MGFSYLRMIHIASTAWTGLTLLYQTNEEMRLGPCFHVREARPINGHTMSCGSIC